MKALAFDIGDTFQLKSGSAKTVFPTFGRLFQTILFNVYAVAGITLLFLLIFGGLGIIIGSGQKDSGKVAQGQKTFTSAIIGFLVIFASYFIIQLIEVLTGAKILNPTL